MKKTYLKPTLTERPLVLSNNILSFSGDGNAPGFDGYTNDGEEIPWN